jgi:DNA-binding response OmpR family regulator
LIALMGTIALAEHCGGTPLTESRNFMPTDPAAPTLLYVEDDLLVQDMMVIDLEDAGFVVLATASGNQAIDLLETQSADIHGLVTDVNLGNGPDGWDVARRARELVSGLPVVYVSAASEHEWTSHGVPNSLMITKPFVTAQVVVAISSLMVASD